MDGVSEVWRALIELLAGHIGGDRQAVFAVGRVHKLMLPDSFIAGLVHSL